MRGHERFTLIRIFHLFVNSLSMCSSATGGSMLEKSAILPFFVEKNQKNPGAAPNRDKP